MLKKETLSDLSDNLEFYRKKYLPNCSKEIKLRYFLSAKRYYKAKFEQTKDEIHKKLYEQTEEVYDDLLEVRHIFQMLPKYPRE